MVTAIERAASHHEYLRSKLEDRFPDADEETLLDTLEGITDLTEMIVSVIRSREHDIALIVALKTRLSDMQARMERLNQRAETKKQIVTSVMDRANFKKIEAPEFTISCRPTPPSLLVDEEGRIPEKYWVPQSPRLDRRGITEALKNGESIPGAILSNGGMTIQVRRR